MTNRGLPLPVLGGRLRDDHPTVEFPKNFSSWSWSTDRRGRRAGDDLSGRGREKVALRDLWKHNGVTYVWLTLVAGFVRKVAFLPNVVSSASCVSLKMSLTVWSRKLRAISSIIGLFGPYVCRVWPASSATSARDIPDNRTIYEFASGVVDECSWSIKSSGFTDSAEMWNFVA